MHLRIQLPLVLGEYDEPFPDIAVVSGSPRDYLSLHPTTALLVVEVSEASLKTDREVKGSLYAKAGIPEYWIVNLKERVVEVYREPAKDARAVLRRLLSAADGAETERASITALCPRRHNC
jgi:Uma2 family endonuclease